MTDTLPTIISIDPGYERLGIAIIQKAPNAKEVLLHSETFKTSAQDDFTTRLAQVGQRVEQLIDQHQPTALAIEKLFFNTNQKTATNVSEVRGAILYAALRAGLQIAEFTPLEIKVAVTGYGRSDKQQVMFMVDKLIAVPKDRKMHDDEWDAIACGLTYFATRR